MIKQILSEEFRRMQKLAGIINESQINEIDENSLKSEIEKINPKSPTIQYVKDKILDDKKYKVTYGGPGKPVGEYEMTFADLISKAWEGKIKKGLEQWNDNDWKQIYDYIKMKEK